MKKFLFLIFTVCALQTQAQDYYNVIKIQPGGLFYQSGNTVDAVLGYNVAYMLGAGYERVLNETWSFQFDANIGFINTTTVFAKPQFNIYVSDDAPSGLYTGFYTVFGFGNFGGSFFGIGPQLGYQHIVKDTQVTINADLEMGYGIIFGATGGSLSGFNIMATIGLGYLF